MGRTPRVHRLLIVAAAILPPAATAGIASPPNIVFILADDLGVNDLACYGRRDR